MGKIKFVFNACANVKNLSKYHGEVDVITNTKIVCEEMVKVDEYKNGSKGVFGKTV